MIIMQNKIKEETAGVLYQLRQANIRTLMVTGKKNLFFFSCGGDVSCSRSSGVKTNDGCIHAGSANLAPLLIFFKNPSLGDNMLTAISVARDCGMVQTHERVIIVDAVPPRDFQPASITWRYTENPQDVIDQVRFVAK